MPIATGRHYRTVPEDRIVDMLLLGGRAYEHGAASAVSATRGTLRSWVAAGLGVREAGDGGLCYDPVEVVNFFKTAGLAERDPFWAEHYVPTGRRLVQDLRAADETPGRFEMMFRRIFTLPDAAGRRLRAPLPLPGDGLADLELAADLDRPGELRISRGRLEARITAGGGKVALHARLGFAATSYRPARDGGSLPSAAEALYLRPREGWIVVTDAVAALARRLAPVGTSPRAAIAAFWDHLLDEFVCGALHYDQIDVAQPCDWVLATGHFDCQLGSALLIALCRAIGLPARLVGGHVLYRLAPTNHYWAEVWLDAGWVPFDLLSWDLSRGGREESWRNHFFGDLDARMTTQRFPADFTGAIGVPIPAEWHLLQSASPGGVAIDLVDLAGQPIYRDVVGVTRSAM